MAQSSLTYVFDSTLQNPPVDFVWFFNHSPIVYRGKTGFTDALSSHPYVERGHKATRYLLVNAYAQIDGEKRYLGGGSIPLADLVRPGKNKMKVPILRHHAKKPAMFLTLKNWPSYKKYLNNPNAAPISAPIQTLFEKKSPQPFGFESISLHNKFWRDPYPVFAKIYSDMSHLNGEARYNHKDLKYFKMPEWWFGSGYVVPGWVFVHYEPLLHMGQQTMLECLEIAKQKANTRKKVTQMLTDELSVVLGFYLTAYAHCVPYSYEMDPLEKKLPSEYFSPARMREMGDCEDTSYEVMRMFKELIALDNPIDSELAVLRNFASGYTCFMTLGSATAAQAGATTKTGEKIMAHMYTLLIPNEYLDKIMYDIRNRPAPRGLEVLLIEGTGCVHPLHHKDSVFPSYMTTEGKRFMDEALTVHKLKSLRRFIYSPSTNVNGVTAEFYLSVVSAISHDPRDGMIVFMDKDGKVAVPLPTIFDQSVDNVRVACIPGTSSEHEAFQGDLERIKLMLGFHEPVNKIYSSSKEFPHSKLIRLIQANTTRMQSGDHDVQFVFPIKYINTDEEGRAVDHFNKSLHKFKGSQILKHNLGNSGSYFIRLWLHPTQ